jgi:hypothetical protein
MATDREIGEALREILIGMGVLSTDTSAEDVQSLLNTLKHSRARKTSPKELSHPNLRLLAQKLIETLVEDHPEDPVKSLRQPISSRKLGMYVEMELPNLGNKKLILDTRVDNGPHTPESLRQLPSGTSSSPWPAPEVIPPNVPVGGDPRVQGCPGSSCPRSGSISVLNGTWDAVQVPVEIVAFHGEGHNGEFAYSVRMFSDVSGRLDIPLSPIGLAAHLSEQLSRPPGASGVLEITGQMLVTLMPRDPAAYGGMERIDLVSQSIVTQRGSMTQWPPRLGDYLQTVGPEAYSLLSARDAPLAIVRNGRIVFTDEIDPFLDARTRVHTFVFTDRNGNALSPTAAKESISGVRLMWEDIRNPTNRVTHYRLYRALPGRPDSIEQIDELIYVSQYWDRKYDGTQTVSYAVVPCTRNVLGDEVLGIGLDYVKIAFNRPTEALKTVTQRVTSHLGFR